MRSKEEHTRKAKDNGMDPKDGRLRKKGASIQSSNVQEIKRHKTG
jgi:hypothetical protein